MVSDSIKNFFHDFETASNDFNAVHSAEQFSDVFMHADSQGIHVVHTPEFIKALNKRKGYFDALGLKSTRLYVAEEVRLNASYTLAKVQVRMHFVQESGEEQDVVQTASYIVRMQDNTPRIVFYLNDQMLHEVMEAHGLTSHKAP